MADDNNSTKMAFDGASDVPTGQENVSSDEVGSLALYYNDSSKVDPKEKLSYIILLLTDQCNQEAISSPMTQAGTPAAIFSPEDFMKEDKFYSQVLSQKWSKKHKFIASKKVIAAEIVRRMPASHTNHNNKTVVQLMTVLAQHPITDSIDQDFIQSKSTRFRAILEAKIGPRAHEDGSNSVGTRMTDIDRLRFIIILCTNEEVLQAYLASANGKSREDVDYQNSDKAPPDWTELMCVEFNDGETEYWTPALPQLHEKFEEPILCKRSDYVLSPDKAKDLVHCTGLQDSSPCGN